ncbi:MAG: alpha/beta hydrolase [Bacteroidetes bacterium]|nr:MAG: alpha/beta hydrolase [Bacteroidota bacterium]
MKIYAFSGLGVDERVFQFLQLDHELIHIEWLPPTQRETLPEYAKRLSKSINTREPFGLLGVSFGGMIAIEVAKKLNPHFTVLISSAARASELPPIVRFIRITKLYKFIPFGLVKVFPFPVVWLFSTRNKSMLKQIIQETDFVFLKWAFGSIVHWKNEEVPENCYTIHGTKDRLIPLRGKADFPVIQGGHFMIVDKADEISQIIKNEVLSAFSDKIS